MPEILMVCYGNLCRSPMAEALLQRALGVRLGQDHGWVVTSAGTGALDGHPAPRHGQSAMARRGLDLSRHLSRAITPALLRRVDRIVCMTRSHVEAVLAMAPSVAGNVTTLGEDVPDPIGGSEHDYEFIAALLEQRIETFADRIAATSAQGAGA